MKRHEEVSKVDTLLLLLLLLVLVVAAADPLFAFCPLLQTGDRRKRSTSCAARCRVRVPVVKNV